MSDQRNAPNHVGDTPPAPTAPGWYPADDSGDRVRWWDGTAWTSAVAARRPGWYEHPEGSGVHVLFDGTTWTRKIRRKASSRALGAMLALAAVGIAVVVWGGTVAVSIPAWDYTREQRDYYCSGLHNDEFLAGIGQLWAIWFLLLVVAASAAALWAHAGRGDWRMSVLAIFGVLSVAGLVPLWLALGAAADCGL